MNKAACLIFYLPFAWLSISTFAFSFSTTYKEHDSSQYLFSKQHVGYCLPLQGVFLGTLVAIADIDIDQVEFLFSCIVNVVV